MKLAVLCLILSWSQSNLVGGLYTLRLFMSNRRVTWPSCECQTSFRISEAALLFLKNLFNYLLTLNLSYLI